MGYGVRQGTHRIELSEFDGSGNWVDIKAGRSYGDRLRQTKAGLQFKLATKRGSETAVDFDMMASRIALFEQSIVAWSLRADEGDAEPMALTRETYTERLSEEVGEWLANEIQGYYDARLLADDDRKNSSGPSTGPSPSTAPSLMA